MANANTVHAIRSALKAAGWNARSVTVRGDHETIHVTIRRPDVAIAAVEAIAAPHERVSRDHASGEILCGGNTFVRVAYARDVLAAMSAPYAARIAEDGTECRVRGWNVHRVAGSAGEHYYRATKPGAREIYCWGRQFCAEQMAAIDAGLPRVHVTATCHEVAA